MTHKEQMSTLRETALAMREAAAVIRSLRERVAFLEKQNSELIAALAGKVSPGPNPTWVTTGYAQQRPDGLPDTIPCGTDGSSTNDPEGGRPRPQGFQPNLL